jgi:hypothetical protein
VPKNARKSISVVLLATVGIQQMGKGNGEGKHEQMGNKKVTFSFAKRSNRPHPHVYQGNNLSHVNPNRSEQGNEKRKKKLSLFVCTSRKNNIQKKESTNSNEKIKGEYTDLDALRTEATTKFIKTIIRINKTPEPCAIDRKARETRFQTAI